MTEIRWTLERGEPSMDGKSRYSLRIEGVPGVRGRLVLSYEEADSLQALIGVASPNNEVKAGESSDLVARLAGAAYDDYRKQAAQSLPPFSDLDLGTQRGYDSMVRSVLHALADDPELAKARFPDSDRTWGWHALLKQMRLMADG